SVTLAAGEANPNIDAGLLPLASLGNYVWLDANRDGVQNEPSGAGRNGITVTLRNAADNSVVGTLVTANDPNGNPGYYTFTNLAPGSYYVCFSLPAGITFTVADQGGNDAADSDANTATGCTPNVTLAAGEVNPTLDAGLFLPGPAIVLKKYTNGFDADVPTGPGLLIGSAVTWTFIITNTGNVPLQDVVLTDNRIGAITCPKTTLAVGETMTCTATGVAQAGQYANTGVVTGTNQLDPSQRVTSTDPSHYFGTNQPVASLGNFVWTDNDRDGQQDAGEPGIGGITVTLRNITGTVIATATTTASGFYSFTNLVPGTYSVCFILPPGTVLTGQGSDPNSDTDSNADPITGCTAAVTLAPGANNPTIDTGVVIVAAPVLVIRKDSVPATGITVTNNQTHHLHVAGDEYRRCDGHQRDCG
ncbi:MAG: hypothetical protein HC853_05035, partial [Anaerolineae bacterium]|nr:hypothetical protein [Anaerolineae bacterium]